MTKPTSREAAEYFDRVARHHAGKGDLATARSAYRNSLLSWYDATLEQPAMIVHLRAAEENFSEFARRDPQYLDLLKIVKAYATQYPGIKESVLCAILDRYKAEEINYVLHFAQKHGEILQTKGGEIYGVNIPIGGGEK